MFYRYAVRYLHRPGSRRVYRLTVTARDADEARAEARRIDPEFTSTTRSPRRLGPVTTTPVLETN